MDLEVGLESMYLNQKLYVCQGLCIYFIGCEKHNTLVHQWIYCLVDVGFLSDGAGHNLFTLSDSYPYPYPSP